MDLIPLPQMSEFLLEDFMLPMKIDEYALSKGTKIPLDKVKAILNNEIDITPEISKKLASFFGVSNMLFYNIQEDLKARNSFSELRYA